MIGKTFGKLQVRGYSHHRYFKSGQSSRYWDCRCECGNEVKVCGKGLRSGNSWHCGCEAKAVRDRKGAGRPRRKGGIYGIYSSMLARCKNPNVKNYHLYGGRGITVCDRWKGPSGFDFFLSDMGPRPHGMSIDRINNDGPYSPENCRWATRIEQNNNRSSNHLIPVNGVMMSVASAERVLGFYPRTLQNRLNMGWSVERATTQPIKPIKNYIQRHIIPSIEKRI